MVLLYVGLDGFLFHCNNTIDIFLLSIRLLRIIQGSKFIREDGGGIIILANPKRVKDDELAINTMICQNIFDLLFDV